MQKLSARVCVLLSVVVLGAFVAMGTLSACSSNAQQTSSASNETQIVDAGGSKQASSSSTADAATLRAALPLTEDYRASFVHGAKGAAYQSYIVLHDTESDATASSVVDYWDSSGAGVAAHFVVNRDGSIVQCVPLDRIAHHAGFGDTGHNAQFGVTDESRDDKVGTEPIGDWARDYGMNSYSIGIEMVHRGDGDDYTQEQLVSVDKLIAYINSYFGTTSKIIDHKMWRTGNSDTSSEFARYLANYQSHNTHD